MKRLVVVLLLVLAVPASAQVESALLSKITFNLTNPGGKSLAMGGAFTAIADDATAAIANPAGLGLLSSVEVGISGKRSDDVIGLVTARSTAVGSNFFVPYPPVHGVNSDISARASGVEFAGAVLPLSRRFVAAVSYAENLRFQGDPGEDGYAYIELRDNRSSGTTRRDFLYEFREYGAVSLRNRLLGLSAAYRVTDRLRIGAGVTLNRMELDLLGDAGLSPDRQPELLTDHDRDENGDHGDPWPRPEHARVRPGASRRSRGGRQADRGRGLQADGKGDGDVRDRGGRTGAPLGAGNPAVLGQSAAGRRRGTGGATIPRAHHRG